MEKRGGAGLVPFRILSTTNPFRKIAPTAKIRARQCQPKRDTRDTLARATRLRPTGVKIPYHERTAICSYDVATRTLHIYLNPEIARMLQCSKMPSPSGAASGGAAADRNHIVAVLPGLTDEIGPALHQLPPQRQRIPAPVVTFNTRYNMTKRRLGDFPLHPMIAAPVPEG